MFGPIRVSGVRLPRPLSAALPVAMRRRLGRSAPERGEEEGGAVRWSRLQLAEVTHPYLIAGAGFHIGLMVGVGVCCRSCCRVAATALEKRKNVKYV